jgi:hypothetical protein
MDWSSRVCPCACPRIELPAARALKAPLAADPFAHEEVDRLILHELRAALGEEVIASLLK